ncbi:helix-turn-helix domain-containing protein [Cronobacter dublinensis]
MAMRIYTNKTLIDVIVTCTENVNGCKKVLAAANQRINIDVHDKKHVYILLEGKLDLYRIVDDILILSIEEPTVIGAMSVIDYRSFHYFKTSTESVLLEMSGNTFIQIIDNNSLWKEMYFLVCDYAMEFFCRDTRFSSKNSYNIIKNNLEIIWSYPVGERSEISIFKFILSRSSISRSSLNKILKELCNGGYIKINRGRLIDMKNLPSKF